MTHKRSPLGDIIPIIGWFDDRMIEGERLIEERRAKEEAAAEIRRRFSDKLNDQYVEETTFRVEIVSDSWVNLTYLDEDGNSCVSGFFTSTVEALMGGLTTVRKHSTLKFSLTKRKGYKKIKFEFQPIADPAKDLWRNLYFETEPNVVNGYVQCIAYGQQCWGQGFEFMLPHLGFDSNSKKTLRKTAYMKLESLDISDHV